MRKFIAKYKQFIIGTVIGSVATVAFALLNFSGGEPAQNVPYVVREVGNDTLLQTSRFSILYRNTKCMATAGIMTIAGTRGDIPNPWSDGGGYVTDDAGLEPGIDQINLYEPFHGIATIYVSGHIFRVSDNATKLKIANLDLDLSSHTPFVVVDKNKKARVASIKEAKKTLAGISPSNLDYGSTAAPSF